MKKTLFLLILLPLLGGLLGEGLLFAQNTIDVSGLKVEAGTVTFNVEWSDAGASNLWSDTVWVFVDYNKNGKMTRMLLEPGSTLTATSSPGVGELIEENIKGAWVVGDARTNGSFSATVQLLTAPADLAGACAYASSYPPVGQYVSSTEIVFTGTPWYEIKLLHEDGYTVETIESGSTFLLPCSYTVSSFTDATGAPGIIKCMPMVGSIGISGPSEVVKGQAVSFGITGSFSSPDASAVNYTWTAAEFSPASEPGTAYAATAPAIAGACTVTLTARSTGYCTTSVAQAVEVLDCTAPSTDIYALTASASAYCPGDVVTFALSGTTPGRSYRLYKDGTAVDVLTGTGGGDVFAGAFAGAGTYTAQVEADGTHCAAPMTGVHVVSGNPAPTGLSLVSTLMAVCAGEPATLTASATGGVSYSLDGSGWQPEADFKVTPQPGVPYTLYAKTDAGCTATQTFTSVVAVNPLPDNLTLTAAPAAICAGESSTLTASADDGVSYSINGSSWQPETVFNVTPQPGVPYTLYVKTAAGCSATKANVVMVTVNPIPNPPTMAGAATQCSPGAITATPGGNGGTGIRWTDDNTITSPHSITASGTYYAVSTSAAGCESSTASISVTIGTAGGDGESSACGCVAGTSDCSGTCITNRTYTTNDGACAGSCNAAYVQQRNQCGTVINARYSTYSNTGCTTPNYTTNDGACTGDCNTAYVRQRNACGTVINSYYSTYPNSSCTDGCGPQYTIGCKSNEKTIVIGLSNAATCQSYCLEVALWDGYVSYYSSVANGNCKCWWCSTKY